ncbi:phage tail protein I [Verminephrobacter aporrectodeae]|nr:phage tail protein I [Verminephrobacter aporrectodeae]
MLPQNATALERAIEAASTRAVSVPLRGLWDVDACPDNMLAWLSWALHVDNWDEGSSPAQKRQAIRDSVHVHRKKGTPWAIKRALAALGVEVEIFDQQAQRAIYAKHGALRLDGTWKLDGSRKIVSLEPLTMIPPIEHWAQFIVRVNLTTVTRDAMFSRIVALIDEYKPIRSWPLFLFWLAFALDLSIRPESALLLDKRVEQRYPWCGRVISDAPDARWRLGRDGDTSSWRLKNCRISSTTTVHSESSASVYRLPRLSEPDRRLDGTWRVGGRQLDTSSHADVHAVSTIALPQTVELTHHQAIHLDYPATPLKLPRPFGFPLRRDRSVLIASDTLMHSRANAWAMPEKLARDASATGATGRRLRLDGSWRLGGPAAPTFDLTITKTKETPHG